MWWCVHAGNHEVAVWLMCQILLRGWDHHDVGPPWKTVGSPSGKNQARMVKLNIHADRGAISTANPFAPISPDNMTAAELDAQQDIDPGQRFRDLPVVARTKKAKETARRPGARNWSKKWMLMGLVAASVMIVFAGYFLVKNLLCIFCSYSPTPEPS